MPESSTLQYAVEDPLLTKFELPLHRLYYPLGFPLELQTNSAEVIEAASENWQFFSQSFDLPPLRIALGVREGVFAEPFSAQPVFCAREHLMSIILDAQNAVMCDFHQAYSFGWITSMLARDHGRLRYNFLTPLAVMMAEWQALAPFHGALIARGDCGVVLAGDSCAGKSTLAYACARAGWTYTSDDGIFLMRDRTDRYAIGNPHVIRFREDARQLFPELANQLVITRPNGKIGIELFTRELGIKTASGTNIEHVVFLNRNHRGPARLRPYSKDQLEAWCERYLNWGTSEVQAAMRRCHRRLLDASIWELFYDDSDDAVRLLEKLVNSRE